MWFCVQDVLRGRIDTNESIVRLLETDEVTLFALAD
jgi:hypothetical protein